MSKSNHITDIQTLKSALGQIKAEKDLVLAGQIAQATRAAQACLERETGDETWVPGFAAGMMTGYLVAFAMIFGVRGLMRISEGEIAAWLVGGPVIGMGLGALTSHLLLRSRDHKEQVRQAFKGVDFQLLLPHIKDTKVIDALDRFGLVPESADALYIPPPPANEESEGKKDYPTEACRLLNIVKEIFGKESQTAKEVGTAAGRLACRQSNRLRELEGGRNKAIAACIAVGFLTTAILLVVTMPRALSNRVVWKDFVFQAWQQERTHALGVSIASGAALPLLGVPALMSLRPNPISGQDVKEAFSEVNAQKVLRQVQDNEQWGQLLEAFTDLELIGT